MSPVRLARRGLRIVAAEVQLRARGEHDLAAGVAQAYRTRPSGVDREWVERIEAVRAALEADGAPLDHGRTVGEVARDASKGPRAARMLLALVRRLRPRTVIEMGTCVGISGSYLAAGLALNGDGGRLVTLEGSPERSSVARSVFARLELPAEVRTGRFDETFAATLADTAPLDLLFVDGHHKAGPTVAYFRQALPHLSPGAVVVFDDIGWSEGMRTAWSAITALPEIRLHVDAGGVGIVRVEPTAPPAT